MKNVPKADSNRCIKCRTECMYSAAMMLHCHGLYKKICATISDVLPGETDALL